MLLNLVNFNCSRCEYLSDTAETKVVESQSSSAGTEKITVNFVPKAESRMTTRREGPGHPTEEGPKRIQGSLFEED